MQPYIYYGQFSFSESKATPSKFKCVLKDNQHQNTIHCRRESFKQQQRNSYLVSSTDQIQIMTIQKFTDHISTKSERDPTIIFTPTLHIFVWVRPQQVTQQAFER